MSATPADPLFALSPVDGRYHDITEPLRPKLSEWALLRHRVLIEVEWLIAMSEEDELGIRALSDSERTWLRSLYEDFDLAAARRIKEFESRVAHDVKSVELYVKERMASSSVADLCELVHFACTSEDISNLAYALMVRSAVTEVWLPAARALLERTRELSMACSATPMVGRTHGQLATPTTVGKELAVFVHRWQRQLHRLENAEYLGKFSGAVGTFSAHTVAYPRADWTAIARRFVGRLGLTWNPLTTQIEPHDWLVEVLEVLAHFGGVLRDFVADVWMYLSFGQLRQLRVAGEVGSSTMPHKVNPARFENAEANIAIANGLFALLARELPVSRLQRDLTDTSKLRTLGAAFGHSLVALTSALRGVQRLQPNTEQLERELTGAWEVLAEAVQTVMRKHGMPMGYEKLKEFSAQGPIDRERLHAMIRSLGLPDEDESALLALTPAGYIGLATQLAESSLG